MKIRLERVHLIPKVLEPGVLYASAEFGIAIHLCACGCGAKVKTPLSPTDWELTETSRGPSLSPSIGNWQEACQSHYWIRRGEIVWSNKWTPEEIAAGRRGEEERTRAHYEKFDRRPRSILGRFCDWLKNLVRL